MACRPAPRTCSSSGSRSARPGWGASAVDSSSRSTPSSRRISPSACAAGRGHLRHRSGRPLGIALGHVAGAVGERDHDREVVGDDVVHLARDPRPLVGGDALLEAVHVGAPRADVEPEHDRGRGHAGEQHEARHERGRGPAGDGQHDADLEHQARRDHPPARLLRRDRVDRDQQREVGHELDVGQPLPEGHDGDDAEHHERLPAAEEQREDQRDRDQPVGAVRARDAEDQQDQHQQQVGERRVTGQAVHASRRTRRTAARAIVAAM